MFGLIDDLQHDRYKKLEFALESYDCALPPTHENNESILKKVNILCLELSRLQDKHAALTKTLISERRLIWFKETILDYKLIPPQHKNSILEYLTQQYYYFIEIILCCDQIAMKDAIHLKSAVLQIMSRPMGQRLILKLNQQCKIIEVVYGDSLSVDRCVKKPENSTSGSCMKYFLYYLFWSKREDVADVKTDSLKKIIFYYPRDYHMAEPHIIAGLKGQLICDTFLTNIAHEFSHCLNHFREKTKSFLLCQLNSAVYHLYSDNPWTNGEEYQTIEQTKSSENAIRAEHNLSLRGGHIGAGLKQYDKIVKIAFFAQLRRANVAEFDKVYFVNLSDIGKVL